MSRPQALFSAFRAALPRRPVAPHSGRGFTFGAGAGSSSSSSSSGFSGARFGAGSRPLHTASFKNTLLRPITVVLIFAPILTGYLGVWQVQRLKWKVALIEEVDRNLAKEPMALPGKIK
jgi:surfeit locus 1 family protein